MSSSAPVNPNAGAPASPNIPATRLPETALKVIAVAGTVLAVAAAGTLAAGVALPTVALILTASITAFAIHTAGIYLLNSKKPIQDNTQSNGLQGRVNTLEGEKENLATQLRTAQENAAAEKTRLENEIAAIRQQLTTAETAQRDAGTEKTRLEGEQANLTTALRAAQENAATTKTRLENEIAAIRQQLTTAETAQRDAGTEKTRLESEQANLTTALRAAQENAATTKTRLENEIAAIRQQLTTAETAQEHAAIEKTRLESEQANLTTALRAAQEHAATEKTRLEGEIAAVRQQLTIAATAQKHAAAEKTRLEGEQTNLTTALRATQENAATEKTQLQQKLNELNLQLVNLRNETNSIIAEQRTEIARLCSRIGEIQKDLAQARQVDDRNNSRSNLVNHTLVSKQPVSIITVSGETAKTASAGQKIKSSKVDKPPSPIQRKPKTYDELKKVNIDASSEELMSDLEAFAKLLASLNDFKAGDKISLDSTNIAFKRSGNNIVRMFTRESLETNMADIATILGVIKDKHELLKQKSNVDLSQLNQIRVGLSTALTCAKAGLIQIQSGYTQEKKERFTQNLNAIDTTRALLVSSIESDESKSSDSDGNSSPTRRESASSSSSSTRDPESSSPSPVPVERKESSSPEVPSDPASADVAIADSILLPPPPPPPPPLFMDAGDAPPPPPPPSGDVGAPPPPPVLGMAVKSEDKAKKKEREITDLTEKLAQAEADLATAKEKKANIMKEKQEKKQELAKFSPATVGDFINYRSTIRELKNQEAKLTGYNEMQKIIIDFKPQMEESLKTNNPLMDGSIVYETEAQKKSWLKEAEEDLPVVVSHIATATEDIEKHKITLASLESKSSFKTEFERYEKLNLDFQALEQAMKNLVTQNDRTNAEIEKMKCRLKDLKNPGTPNTEPVATGKKVNIAGAIEGAIAARNEQNKGRQRLRSQLAARGIEINPKSKPKDQAEPRPDDARGNLLADIKARKGIPTKQIQK